MDVVSLTGRMVMKAASLALLWLLTAAIAESAPGLRRGVNDAPVCDARSPILRKLPRHAKSLGGPVARKYRSRSALSFDLTARLHRAVRHHIDEDRDAIQSDAAATGIDPGNRAPGLRSLGIVIGSVHKQPRTLAFSPRSPRGPPRSV